MIGGVFMSKSIIVTILVASLSIFAVGCAENYIDPEVLRVYGEQDEPALAGEPLLTAEPPLEDEEAPPADEPEPPEAVEETERQSVISGEYKIVELYVAVDDVPDARRVTFELPVEFDLCAIAAAYSDSTSISFSNYNGENYDERIVVGIDGIRTDFDVNEFFGGFYDESFEYSTENFKVYGVKITTILIEPAADIYIYNLYADGEHLWFGGGSLHGDEEAAQIIKRVAESVRF